MHPLRWYGITSEKIIGPYFFGNDEKVAVNVNGNQYRAMIENFLWPRGTDNPQLWFQQDGATANTARPTMALLLRKIFWRSNITAFF